MFDEWQDCFSVLKCVTISTSDFDCGEQKWGVTGFFFRDFDLTAELRLSSVNVSW